MADRFGAAAPVAAGRPGGGGELLAVLSVCVLGLVVLYAVLDVVHAVVAPPAAEGLDDAPRGIYVGPSADLLRRTAGATWDGGRPVVPYDPRTQRRFAGAGLVRAPAPGGEVLEVAPLGEGRLAVRRLVAAPGDDDAVWYGDWWLDGRYDRPTPAELPRTRWTRAPDERWRPAAAACVVS